MIDWITKEESWDLPVRGFRAADEGSGAAASPGSPLRFESPRGCLELSLAERSALRLRFARKLPFSTKASRAIEPGLAAAMSSSPAAASLESAPGAARLKARAGDFLFELDREGGAFTVSAGSGLGFSSAGPIRLCRDSISAAFELAPGESIYGLGEKTGFLDRRGRRFEMWNTDRPTHTPDADPLYQSIPFLIRFDGRVAQGLFLDSSARSLFDLGFAEPGLLGLAAFDEELDLYFIEGPSIAEVVSSYGRLTGRMELPPRWALGFGQSRWSYYPEEAVLGLASRLREDGIPCDSIYLDIDYMDGYRVFSWDLSRFPDPEDLCAKLRASGIRAVTIVDPGVKRDARYAMYREGCAEGHFCKLPDGSVYHGRVWPGEAAYPDFSRSATREWWAAAHRELLGRGVSGIWCDMNEPSDFSRGPEADADRRKATVPNELLSDEDGSPRPFALTHNAYGLDMCRAAARAFELHKPGERPFVLTRAGYAGVQRYAAVWSGDNHSWWEHLAQSLPMLLGMGLSGLAFVGSDAGGFQGDADAELYCRWMELASLTPFFRAHAAIDSRPQEPWAFGAEAESVAREAIRLRYSLLPYIYSLFRAATQDGLPIMRPLVLDFPRDERSRGLCDEFLLGPSLLVAPVLRPGERERLVYLPEGLWYDFYTGEAAEGGRSLIAPAPLGRIPLFARSGSVLALAESAASTAAMDFSHLRLRAYAGAEGSFELYEDDGESLAYKDGEFSLTRYAITRTAAGEWSLSSERLRDGWMPGRASPAAELVGGPWAR